MDFTLSSTKNIFSVSAPVVFNVTGVKNVFTVDSGGGINFEVKSVKSDFSPAAQIEFTVQSNENTFSISSQGTQGATGADGGTFILAAGEAVGAGRVMRADAGLVYYADGNDAAERNILGISINSAVLGGNVTIKPLGVLQDAGYSFTPGADLFYNSSGVVVEAVPTTILSRQIAHALTADTIFINLEKAILL